MHIEGTYTRYWLRSVDADLSGYVAMLEDGIFVPGKCGVDFIGFSPACSI